MGGNSRKKQRVIAALLCLCLIAVVMICGLNCAKHALHHCDGGNCPICDVLYSSKQVLHQLAILSGLTVLFAVTSAAMLLLGGLSADCGKSGYSLVNLKIRLNH